MKRLPIRAAEPAPEHPRIEAWRRVQHAHRPAPGVHGHDRSGASLEGFGRDPLQVDVERQTKIVSGAWLDRGDDAELPTHSRNHHPPFSRFARNKAVFGNLDAGGSNHRIWLDSRIGLDGLLRDRPQMAHRVRGQPTIGIAAPKPVDNGQLRVVALVGTNCRHLVPAEILPDHKRCHAADTPFGEAFTEGREVAHAGLSQEQTGGVELLRVVRKQEQLPGGDVFRQDAAPTIVNPTPRARQREPTEPIVLGQITPLSTVEKLQIDQTDREQPETEEDNQEQGRGASFERPNILAKLHQAHRSFRTR